MSLQQRTIIVHNEKGITVRTETEIQLSITKPEAEPRAWQVNAMVNGVDAGEITYYHGTKKDAREDAMRRIKQDGRLPHDRYIPA